MDDSFGILKQNQEKTAHLAFLQCLNDVHPRLNFTFKLEENGQLPFLDALLVRQQNGLLTTKVY